MYTSLKYKIKITRKSLYSTVSCAPQGPFSQCAKGHVAYKPKRGDALLFWDMRPDSKSEVRLCDTIMWPS
jgi:hypothetical protein